MAFRPVAKVRDTHHDAGGLQPRALAPIQVRDITETADRAAEGTTVRPGGAVFVTNGNGETSPKK